MDYVREYKRCVANTDNPGPIHYRRNGMIACILFLFLDLAAELGEIGLAISCGRVDLKLGGPTEFQLFDPSISRIFISSSVRVIGMPMTLL